MALTKQDLTSIDNLVQKRVNDAVMGSEERLTRLITASEDRLVQAVAEGFADVDERFDMVNRRFDRVEKRLGNLEGDMQDVKSRLADTAGRVEVFELKQRVERLEDKVFEDHKV